MQQITGIGEEPKQRFSIVLDDNSIVTWAIRFKDNQVGWFYDISYQEFALNNRRLVTSLNILFQFQNVLPFGMAIVSTDIYDPAFISDFSDERIQVFVLDAGEVEEINLEFFS